MFRLLLIATLLLALFGSLVWFGSLPPAPDLGVPPTEEEVVVDYDSFIGDRVLVSGTVTVTDPVTIRAETRSGRAVELQVIGAANDISGRGSLVVYGTLEPDRRVVAVDTVQMPRYASVRTYAVSFAAVLWVLVRGLGHWRFDWRAFAFVRRPVPVTVRALVDRATDGVTGGSDA